jgi:hypothetical protein
MSGIARSVSHSISVRNIHVNSLSFLMNVKTWTWFDGVPFLLTKRTPTIPTSAHSVR